MQLKRPSTQHHSRVECCNNQRKFNWMRQKVTFFRCLVRSFLSHTRLSTLSPPSPSHDSQHDRKCQGQSWRNEIEIDHPRVDYDREFFHFNSANFVLSLCGMLIIFPCKRVQIVIKVWFTLLFFPTLLVSLFCNGSPRLCNRAVLKG